MSLSKMDLTGRVALVTGGGRGLGREMALALAEVGADVAVASRTLSALEKTAEEIRRRGSRSLALPTDVSKIDQVNRMIKETLDEFGRIDILINNAGTVIRKSSLEITEADWDKVVDTILKASFFCAQAAAKAMIKQKKGKIINIGSLTSVRGLPRIIPYVASRGGILQLTKGLAVEWAPYNINVNAIGPGYFKTQQTAPLFADKEWVKRTVARIPLGRTGVPRDLAGVVVFLASEASDYITGQMIFVDGGWLAAL